MQRRDLRVVEVADLRAQALGIVVGDLRGLTHVGTGQVTLVEGAGDFTKKDGTPY